MMKAFFAAVLSVIAIGVMLIAYGLFNPRVATAGAYPTARPMLANERVGLVEDGYAPYSTYPAYAAYTAGHPAMAYPVNDVRAVQARPVSYETYPAPAPRQVVTAPRATRSVSRVEPERGRDWKKTAMIIGGTTAAGAGVGAIFGGKKGALIGAAIGGGAATIYEVKKR
jgi:hypothetical protein